MIKPMRNICKKTTVAESFRSQLQCLYPAHSQWALGRHDANRFRWIPSIYTIY